MASDGSVYLSGGTTSSSEIASGGYQNTLGGESDAFLAKFNVSGIRQWATYYSGTGSDGADSGINVVLSLDGSIYISASTNSETSIASNGFENLYGGVLDAYLVKFVEGRDDGCCRDPGSGSFGLRRSVVPESEPGFVHGARGVGKGADGALALDGRVGRRGVANARRTRSGNERNEGFGQAFGGGLRPDVERKRRRPHDESRRRIIRGLVQGLSKRS